MQKRLIRVVAVALVLWSIPMALTLLNSNSHIRGGSGGGWDWNLASFVLFVPIIFCVGLAIDFAWRTITNALYRVLTVAAIVLALLLAWVQVVTDRVSETIRIFVEQPSATDYRNTTFLIDGREVRLINGVAAGGDVMTRYF